MRTMTTMTTSTRRAGKGRHTDLDELLEHIDPEDFLVWLGVDYITTRGRSGVQLNIKECPRCGGNDRKVYLNAETGLGNCFHGSCVDNPGYNLFSFAKAFFDGDGRRTVEQLKEYASTVGWRPKPKRLSPDVKIVSQITLPDSYAIPIRGKNLAYLGARGIGVEIAEQLGLRWCRKGGFPYKAPDGTERVQDYSNRVIIPVFDLLGEVRTFQGRDITGTAVNKYLFPPGLAGTGQFLYNAHNAIGCETLVICEGAFDVAATLVALKDDHTEHYGVVGSFGKKISMSEQDVGEDQLSQLYSLKAAGAKKFVFLWDGEAQTLLDACDEAMQLKRYGFDTWIATLPDDKDPNEVPAKVVRQAVRNAFAVSPMSIMKVRARLFAARA